MPTAIVPTQHALRSTARGKKAKNTFDVGNLGAILIIIFVACAGHLSKELRRRELPLIAYNHDLAATGNGANRINGLDLARLVHHQQIEGHLAGSQELSDGERAHHHDWFQRLDG